MPRMWGSVVRSDGVLEGLNKVPDFVRGRTVGLMEGF